MLVDGTSIIYIIVMTVFLEGCSYNNIYRCHDKCESRSMNSDAIVYMPQNKEINAWYSQKNSITDGSHRYNSMNHGSYHKSVYIVKSGDTLFYIAWITGTSCLNLAKINNIKDINVLKVGQILQVYHNTIWSYFSKISGKIFVSFNNGDNTINKRLFFFINQLFFFRTNKTDYPDMNISHDVISYSKTSELVPVKNWHWPTNGTIINTFSDSERGNKGIDISGVLGQPILAASNGKVVYVGNTLKGYGNLIIIKHDDCYLSAYAHNDVILVTEQQKVKIGDKIATMGNSGTNKVKLHFEIRYKGKSVDPLYYLQK